MAVNQSSGFASDIEAYIQDETLPLAFRELVAYQFGDPLELPAGRGTTYTATRYNRVPLPFAPLSEGVPPIGETMTIGQVSATAQQWGDSITITDVAELTIKHPLFKKAIELCGFAIGETLERNTFNTLATGTQVNYAGSVGSRNALGAGNVMSLHEINRAMGILHTIGAPMYSGSEMTDIKIDAEDGGAKASSNPRQAPHYVALIHPLVVQDLRENSTVVTAWSYSDINRLYNSEIGELNGIRFCQSNMIQNWTGYSNAASSYPTYTGVSSGGSLANGTYYVILTGSDTQNQYESQIYAVTGAITVGGSGSGSITFTTPNIAGYTWNAYIGTSTTTVTKLATSVAGPTTGPMAGQAVQMPGNTAVTLTGTGISQTPPAAPANGIAVYPTYIIGRGAYGQVVLKDVEFSYLKDADKSDKLNQLRIVGWKTFYGTLIQNNQFFMRIEAASAFSSAFG